MATKTKRKKRTTTGLKKRVKIAGKTFTHKQCSTTKGEAKKAAEAQRKKGRTARVLKNGTQYCVYVGAMSKTRKKK